MTDKTQTDSASPTAPAAADGTTPPARPAAIQQPPGEIGGREGPEPTRYGDWEVNGRCSDF
jgi:hypothetical protein